MAKNPLQASLLVRVARGAIWAPVGVLVVHSVGASVFGHEPYVDPVTHLLGGIAVAFFIRYVCDLSVDVVGPMRHLVLDLLAFGLTCTVALLWEFGEFASDSLLATNVQLSLGNTMRDLALGSLGSVLYLVALRSVRRSTKAT